MLVTWSEAEPEHRDAPLGSPVFGEHYSRPLPVLNRKPSSQANDLRYANRLFHRKIGDAFQCAVSLYCALEGSQLRTLFVTVLWDL